MIMKSRMGSIRSMIKNKGNVEKGFLLNVLLVIQITLCCLNSFNSELDTQLSICVPAFIANFYLKRALLQYSPF